MTKGRPKKKKNKWMKVAVRAKVNEWVCAPALVHRGTEQDGARQWRRKVMRDEGIVRVRGRVGEWICISLGGGYLSPSFKHFRVLPTLKEFSDVLSSTAFGSMYTASLFRNVLTFRIYSKSMCGGSISHFYGHLLWYILKHLLQQVWAFFRFSIWHRFWHSVFHIFTHSF